MLPWLVWKGRTSEVGTSVLILISFHQYWFMNANVSVTELVVQRMYSVYTNLRISIGPLVIWPEPEFLFITPIVTNTMWIDSGRLWT